MTERALPQNDLRVWRWGPCSASLWSVLIYLLMISGFAIRRLANPGTGTVWPLYEKAEFIEGSYPLFWLVYFCLPFLARDFYVHRKTRQPFSIEFKLGICLSLLPTVLAYRYVFGWY